MAAACGLCGVFCSAMLYVATRRPLWTVGTTLPRFVGTTAVLGAASILLACLALPWLDPSDPLVPSVVHTARTACAVLVASTAVKLAIETSVLAGLRNERATPQRRSALLLTGPLGAIFGRRLVLGILGGVVFPAILLSEPVVSAKGYDPVFFSLMSLVIFATALAGEFHERFLFFRASVPSRMPGGIAP